MAAEIVSITSSFSSIFYITIIITIVLVTLIILFNRKLKYNYKQTLKSILISFLISLPIQLLLWFALLLLFMTTNTAPCKTGASCPSGFETSLYLVPYTFPAIFLIVLFFYYLIKVIKNK